MSRLLLASAPAAVLAALFVSAMSASAHDQGLTCRTVDGNTVCAGPGAVSCQTVNGKTVCTQGTPARTTRHKCDDDRDEPAVERPDDNSADDPDRDAGGYDYEADDAPLSHMQALIR